MKLKKISSLFIIMFIILVCFAPICIAEDYNDEQNQNFTNYSGFETRSFDVTVKIDKNNVYHVTERILVDFQSQRHGIFRYIPVKSSLYRDIDGDVVEIPTRAKISNVKVKGHKVDKSNEDNNLILKIGDPDEYVYGLQEYIISYRYRPHDDRTEQFDEVYFDLLPTGWESPIDAASFTIHMPDGFDKNKLYFYAGQQGSQSNDNLNIQVEGNTISAKTINKVPRFYGVTMRLELEDGYFKSQKTDTALIGLMWLLLIIPPVLLALLWLLYGRDPVLVKPITVMPPNDMTSADVGYLIDDVVEDRDILSLLFYWADKGYIQIAEGKKDDFILTKLKPLSENSKSYEHTMFDRLFRSGDTVKTSELSGKFYQTLHQAKAQVSGEFNFRESTRLYTKSSTVAKSIAPIIAVIPVLAVGLIASYVNVSSVLLGVITIIATFFLLVSFLGIIRCVSSWNGLKASTRLGLLVVPIIFIIIIAGVSIIQAFALANVVKDMPQEFASSFLNPVIPTIMAIIAALIGLLFSSIMKKRTPLMNAWYGEVLGLKEFITLAEKDRLEMLIHENPSYFYNILPYAYVLGVSDTWAKKFENIAIPAPQWYASTQPLSTFNTILFVNSINRNMTGVQQSLSVPPASSGKGGGFSSGGGGFSGGGFSGGGGGGGGGGSW